MTATTPSSTMAPPKTTAILVIVLVSYFMIILDNSVIFTGLPSIQQTMNLSETGLSWATDAYTLVFGGFLLIGARSGDLLGRRRMFIIGLALFAAASLLVGIAPNGAFMIAARALQGIGAAIVAPLSLSLLTSNFPEGRERIRAVSAYGAIAGIGAAAGLIVGGAAAEWISWRAGFLINVPIGIAMILAAIRFVPETRRQRGQFDLPGALLSTIGVGGIVLGVVNSADQGWTAPLTIVSLVVGALAIAALIVNEKRATQPIMPLRVFHSRERSGAYIGRFLFGATMMPFFYFTSQFLQGVYHYTPFQTGLAFLPMTIANFIVAVNVPRLSRRFGNAGVMVAGLTLLLAGIVWMTQLDAGSPYMLGLGLPMIVYGIGQGMALGPLTGAGVAGASDDLSGAASGLVNTSQQLGGTIGIATLVAVTVSIGDPLADRVTHAYTGGAFLMAGALLAAIILILPRDFQNRRRTHTTQEQETPAE